MMAFLPKAFLKGLLHGVLIGISLWLVNLLVINKQVLVIGYLLIIFLPLLIVGYYYRKRSHQSLIQHMIIIKERIFLYPLGVALYLSFLYTFDFVGVSTFAAYNPLYLTGIFVLAIFSLTAKLSIIIWFGSLFCSKFTQFMRK
jgi:hypothetical protein